MLFVHVMAKLKCHMSI